MLRKLLIRTWVGPLPPWMDQWRANVKTLEAFGFDFLVLTDYADYQERCRQTLGVTVDIKPGTRKIADLDPALGLIFADKIAGYDFWSHVNLDCVFGRIDRFVPDEFLESLDVFGGDPDAINGIFSLYRNTPFVNNLFRRVPGWKQIFEDSRLHGFDETAFSAVVREANAAGEIRFKSGFWHSWDKQPHHYPPNMRLLRDGTLMDVPLDKEVSLFHFNRTRQWPIKNPDAMPDLENIKLHLPVLEEYAAKSSFILELGAGAGTGSMRAFCRGLRRTLKPDPLYISVDVDPSCPQYGAPPDAFWYLLVGESEDPATAARVCTLADGRKPDLIFIDTTHTYEVMRRELRTWERLASDDTIWLFHDTWMGGEYNHMTDAIKEFAGRNGWKYDDLSTECEGLGRMRRPR